MASLGVFESTLKEVVQAKRLSASKMTKLTEIALKSMENDTQLVSILYRTHKSLPPAAKVHSLYAFDALTRAARSQVNKHGLTGDVNSETGNCATFLLKVEGVLEGLFQDMISSGTVESKEKTQKILDIWTKSNTFSSAVLTRLAEVMKETDKKDPTKVKSATPPDPRTVTQAPAVTTTAIPLNSGTNPALPTVDHVQSTLLALLSQAAAINQNGQTNTNNTQPQLDPNQLALLQQLTQTAKLTGAGSPSPPSAPSFTPPAIPNSASAEPVGGPSRTIPYGDERYDSSRREPRYNRFNSPDRGRDRDDHHDDRLSSRGPFKGSFRGRGRGEGRGRWDDRDRFRDRGKDRDFSPPRRRSRSRSPRRHGSGRDVKPYSPPRRPTMASRTQEPVTSAIAEPDKDEFGRDIRPQSPQTVNSVVDPRTLPQLAPGASSLEAPVSPNNQISLSKQIPSVAANTLSPTPDAAASNSVSSSQLGLDKFNIATFDFTAASSWEALGKMWHVTYGYWPSEAELMQFVMSGGNAGTAMVSSQSDVGQPSKSDWAGPHVNAGNHAWRGGNRGRGYTQGRGNGFGRGNTREDDAYMGASDAIVLGGVPTADGEEDIENKMITGIEKIEQIPSEGILTDGHTSNAGGRMQRVGDKWVFVREAASGVV